jgi:UDPglucose--hexose-1-phosphate uridylyltransferase
LPQLRKDPVIGRWVIIATERSQRPADYNHSHLSPNGGGSIPEHKDDCPFCYGNEAQTPPEILAYRDGTPPNTPGWSVRVVSNKYPALRVEGELNKEGMGIYDIMNGIGAHEVIIETPRHNASLGNMQPAEVESILWAINDRMTDLRNDKRLKYIMVFKNCGADAGATLEHPHSQLIATPVIPKRVSEEISGCDTHYRLRERCIFCDIIKQELYDKRRIILETEKFLVVAPFASRFPFELWMLPKRHIASFRLTNQEEMKDLSWVLREVVRKMEGVLTYPPYNFMLHTSPCQDEELNHYHWHIELTPKLTKVAGFEWGTGFYINATPPEDVANIFNEYS